MTRKGLLWFDNDPRRPLEEKVKRAAQRYKEKFGRMPNVCYINPTLLAQNEGLTSLPIQKATVKLVASPTILPNHFLVSFVEKR